MIWVNTGSGQEKEKTRFGQNYGKCDICEFVWSGETRRVSNSMLGPNLNRVQMSCVPYY